MAETQLKKTEFIPFLDTGTSGSAVYKRIDKSTIFDLALNAEEEAKDYISTEVPVSVIKQYAPEMAQEIELYEGNGVYDFVFKKLYNLAIGDEAKVPCLLCFGGTEKLAWLTTVTLVVTNLNTVDGKLLFNIKFGGNVERGTYSIVDGVPTFTKASAASQSASEPVGGA